MKRFLLIILILTGQVFLKIPYALLAQTPDEIQNLKLKPSIKSENPYIAYSQHKSGEVDQFTGWLFRFYKKFISSQDYGNCSFTPSCSEYAVIAIRKQGLLVGSINTLDRLTRCHGKNNSHYMKAEEKNLLIDEVRDHNYEKE